VQRMNFKCLECILIKRSYEDDRVNMFGSNFIENVESIHFRHLDIEKDQIRSRSLNRFDSFFTIAAFADNFNLRITLEKQTKVAPRERFVVDNLGFDLVPHRAWILDF